MSSDKPFFLAQNEGFSEATANDDFLHPEVNQTVEGDSLTETQYLGFNVPEHGIHALGYLWHHPNLGVVTGGLMAWKGIKKNPMMAELFDMRDYHSDTCLANDLHEYRLDNSYSVKVIEPLKRLHMRYDDPKRGNQVDLEFAAVTPAVMFGDGKHFEQGVRAQGKLVLRGESYDVNSYNVRDRSWGKLRPEEIMPVPPVAWMTAWFSEDLMFNCNLMDHAGSSDLVKGDLAIPAEAALNGGWVVRGGHISRIVNARKKVVRRNDTFAPDSIKLFVTEDHGRESVLEGKLVASCPWGVWSNIHSNISLIHWTYEGKTGYGDCQDVIWNDFAVANQR
ncbi:MAG: hypothetical protein KJP07_20745 [Desulfatitalea sp.]|nr:hypothetical protein [Desulfatitalea sp.]